MEIQIDGGIPLKGEVDIQSSKNAVLPMLAAVLLAKGITAFIRCPKISDVYHMIELMEELGCHIWWEGENLCVDTGSLTSCEITKGAASKVRSSVIFLGSLLGRCKEAKIPYPGGCVIGKRPIDLHMKGLECLGVSFTNGEEAIYARAVQLKGGRIHLPYPSVGATQNLMLAAVLASGITTITGCAKEPEVVELSCFLNCMGADIRWKNAQTLVIRGVESLHPVVYEVPPDRIVAGTYMLAVAATRGKAVLHGVPWQQLGALNVSLMKMGAVLSMRSDVVTIEAKEAVHGIDYVQTQPYPGFPTDLQPQIVTALTMAEEDSKVEETVFESRFAVLQELKKMKASIEVSGREISITGARQLQGAEVCAKDLRGGAALVTAGLMAQGTTVVKKCEYLERGYVDIVRDMQLLGGTIRKRQECAEIK